MSRVGDGIFRNIIIYGWSTERLFIKGMYDDNGATFMAIDKF